MTDPTIVRPTVSSYEGQDVLGRMQAIMVTQAQNATVEWIFRRPASAGLDKAGNALNLEDILSSGSSSSSDSSSSSSVTLPDFKVRFIEALSQLPGSSIYEMNVSVHDAQAGTVRWQLSSELVAYPGVYRGEIAALRPGTSEILFVQPLFLLVERGLWGDLTTGGSLGWSEIKLSVRDSAPEDSYLNDQLEWDLAEVCQAIIRPVAYFNECQPPIRLRYTTTSYPFREQWLRATVGELYRLAASCYRREAVQYSAAGVALNDKNKAAEYDQVALLRDQEYKMFVRTKKIQLNAERAFGSAGTYPYRVR